MSAPENTPIELTDYLECERCGEAPAQWIVSGIIVKIHGACNDCAITAHLLGMTVAPMVIQ